MTALLPNVDPDGLLEFSVVFTDRSLNHMSTDFQSVMCDISKMLTSVYNTDTCAIVPGGGTFAMESVAREFATDKKVMVLRNGWFSFRWSQIFETGDIPSEVVLCPILYCIDVFSTYLGKILDFILVHWSFIFVSHVSRLIVEFI